MRRIIVLFGLAILLAGCADGTGYRIASFFFDGVPEPPPKAEPVATPLATPEASAAAVKSPSDGAKDAGAKVGAAKEAKSSAQPLVYLHNPYASGSCDICHDSGSSNALALKGNKLCLTCHTNVLTRKKVIHVPALADCTICHDPHKSANPAQLKKPVPAVCLDCHVKDKVQKVHGEIPDCRTCHNPHQSDVEKLLEFK